MRDLKVGRELVQQLLDIVDEQLRRDQYQYNTPSLRT
jgi:hypothetical protein